MLPEKFLIRTRQMLGDEYPAFEDALSRPSVKGVRANGFKCDGQELKKIFPMPLTETGYAENGFIVEGDGGLGNLPEHHAGMIYSQDPGAMATLSAIKLWKGAYVLDACAAPGGKTTQAADMIGADGFILSNEFVPKRAKVLVSNLERMGAPSAMVTSMDTGELRRLYRAVFDLVICDAPCSGEGMFRKYDEAVEDWSEENVAISAKRQAEILNNCAPLVKSGGYLLYSTCTYSQEENEENVRAFISEHPDFSIAPVREELARITSDGIDVRGDMPALRLTRRFYPHMSRGEGQYVALLKKDGGCEESPAIFYKDSSRPVSKKETAVIERFLRENMKSIPVGRYVSVGDGISLVSHGMPIPPHSVFMAGTMLGTLKGENLIPHHHFFSVYGKDMKNRVMLKKGDPRVEKYLRGEEIDCDAENVNGWCAVCYEGAVIGGGKISGGKVKNHYPKGLRAH